MESRVGNHFLLIKIVSIFVDFHMRFPSERKIV